MKLGQNVFLDESRTNLKMGHVGSKYRSQGPILEKPFVRSRGHIFSPIIMKFGQNIFLDELLGQVWSKTKSIGQMLDKPYVCSRGHIFSLIIMKLGSTCMS